MASILAAEAVEALGGLAEGAAAGGEEIELDTIEGETIPKEREGGEGSYNYSGGGARGARYEGIGFEQFGYPQGYVTDFRVGRGFENLRAPNRVSSSAFTQDRAPQGAFERILGRPPKTTDVFYADYAGTKSSQLTGAIFGIINDIYDIYRTDKQLDKQEAENRNDRYKIGIVFNGRESRDDLIKKNKIPAYYSTSNIKSLLRKGIMPFGWNSEMAVEQGFGKEIYIQELKKKSDEKSQDFLHRAKIRSHLKSTIGDVENLRDRLKTRKLIEYYSQF